MPSASYMARKVFSCLYITLEVNPGFTFGPITAVIDRLERSRRGIVLAGHLGRKHLREQVVGAGAP